MTEEQLAWRLGTRLRRYRQMRGWKSSDLAIRLGCGGKRARDIEDGLAHLSLKEIQCIMSITGLKMSELFGERRTHLQDLDRAGLVSYIHDLAEELSEAGAELFRRDARK